MLFAGYAQEVVVLRPTRQKIGHFGDVSPSQSLGLVWKKLNPTPQIENSVLGRLKFSEIHEF